MYFMASVIMRSVLFWALSKLSRLSLAVAAYANKLYSNLGLYVSLFNCSLVAWLEYLLHVLASWRIIISFWLAFPSAGQYVVSLLSNKIGIMIASLHFCRSVRTEWSAVVIYFHVADLSKCVNISFVAPSGTWDFLYFGWRLLGPRLVSGILSCVPMPRVLLSLFRSFFFLVFHNDWNVTYIFIFIRYTFSCLFVCHHSLARLLQLSNCSCHSIVWHVSNASDNTVQDSVWMFWFFTFSLKLLSYA